MKSVTIKVKIPGIDEAAEKAQELLQKIEEAKTAATELASLLGELKLETII